jgi:hypothetical protein
VYPPCNVFVGFREAKVYEIEHILVFGSGQPHHKVRGLDVSMDVSSCVHLLYSMKLCQDEHKNELLSSRLASRRSAVKNVIHSA